MKYFKNLLKIQIVKKRNILERIKSTFVLLLLTLSNKCFAVDIIANQTKDVVDTFKGTVITGIIIAEVIGAYAYFHKSRDLKGTITGLVFVLLMTGWAVTKVGT